MKLIRLGASFTERHNIGTLHPFNSMVACAQTLADTALLIGGRPFFVPAMPGPYVGHLVLAIRICRLGRHIGARFASRYYDSMTVGLAFVAEGWRQQLADCPDGTDLMARSFDGAVSLGRQTTLPEAADLCLGATLGEQTVEAQIGNWRERVEQAIVWLSQSQTLRQGDILLLETSASVVAAEDTQATATLQGETLLKFNVK